MSKYDNEVSFFSFIDIKGLDSKTLTALVSELKEDGYIFESEDSEILANGDFILLCYESVNEELQASVCTNDGRFVVLKKGAKDVTSDWLSLIN